jgi:hypothetical protein
MKLSPRSWRRPLARGGSRGIRIALAIDQPRRGGVRVLFRGKHIVEPTQCAVSSKRQLLPLNWCPTSHLTGLKEPFRVRNPRLRGGLQDVTRFAGSERQMRAADTGMQVILAPMGFSPGLAPISCTGSPLSSERF